MRIIFCFLIVFSIIGCSAPEPTPIPESSSNIFLNNKLSTPETPKLIPLNEGERGGWNVYYTFGIDNDNVILKLNSVVDFMYLIQHASTIQLSSNNKQAINNFIFWLKRNGVDRSVIETNIDESDSLVVLLYRNK